MTVRATVHPGALARRVRRTMVSVNRLLRTLGPAMDDGPPQERLRWLFDALQSDDLVLETIRCGEVGTKLEVVYIRSIVDQDRLSSVVLKMLETSDRPDPRKALPHADRQSNGQQIIDRLLQGWVAAFKQGSPVAYLTPIPGRKGRSVTESTSEPELVAAKDSFVEDLDTNINLVRFQLATPDLTVKLYKLGRLTSRRVAFLYVRGICDPALVDKMTSRLAQAPQVDAITSGVELNQLVFHRSLSPFPQAQQTERPSSVVRSLAAGRGSCPC